MKLDFCVFKRKKNGRKGRKTYFRFGIDTLDQRARNIACVIHFKTKKLEKYPNQIRLTD